MTLLYRLQKPPELSSRSSAAGPVSETQAYRDTRLAGTQLPRQFGARRGDVSSSSPQTILDARPLHTTVSLQPLDHIGVCIPTFRRPKLLEQLLHALEQQ